MIVPDLNLLLYAYNPNDSFHNESRDWWESLMNSDEPVYLPATVIFGFLRIATHKRVFSNACTPQEAVSIVESWLDQPNVRIADSDSESLKLSLELIRTGSFGGNLVPDIQIAGIAIRLGATIHSNDTDFRKFDGVKVYNPLLS